MLPIAQLRFHRLPKVLFEAFDIDLFSDSELIQHDFLVDTASGIETLHRMDFEHVAQVFLLFGAVVVSKTLFFKVLLLEAHLDRAIVGKSDEVLLRATSCVATVVHIEWVVTIAHTFIEIVSFFIKVGRFCF